MTIKSINVQTGETTIRDYTDEELLARHEARLLEESKITYKDRRAKEYPSIHEQLDMIYHGGLDAWKAEIKKIKDKYPKPE